MGIAATLATCNAENLHINLSFGLLGC